MMGLEPIVGRDILKRALAAVVCLVLCACGFSSVADTIHAVPTQCPKGGFMLNYFTMSPDGETVAFNYRGPEHGGMGLLEWRTGKLTRVPHALALGQPRYSYDGKRMVGIKNGGIAVVDLAAHQVVEVIGKPKDGHGALSFPVFQPETGNILYVAHNEYGKEYFMIFNILNSKETPVFNKHLDFYSIFNNYFINANEIIFTGINPHDEAILTETLNVIGNNKYFLAAYVYKFKNKPELIFPRLQSNKENTNNNELNSISATPDGRIFVYIGLSKTAPYSGGHGDYKGLFNLEIFKFEDDKQTQMTDLRSHLAYATVSYDGSAVAFGSDPTRHKCFDLMVLDMKTGTVKQTGLLERLKSNPDFQ